MRPALVHCNDYNTMWIGVAAKLGGARVIYDSHELWPDRNLRPEPRPWLMLCEALFVRVADEVITTSPGYADVLARRYRIARPRVVRNVPDLPLAAHGSMSGAPLAVYFGAVTQNRGLDDAIAALAQLPALRLRIVGPEAWGFRAELERLAAAHGVSERVELLDPVPPDRAGDVLADADVGLALIQPACLSYELTLPNKVFEYCKAGLPVLATDLPVLGEFVREHGIGLTAKPGDRAGLARQLAAILGPEANEDFRAAARGLGRELTWESEREGLVAAYGPADTR
jgi:glycosyltransferase involved in cell wall biosynthesis